MYIVSISVVCYSSILLSSIIRENHNIFNLFRILILIHSNRKPPIRSDQTVRFYGLGEETVTKKVTEICDDSFGILMLGNDKYRYFFLLTLKYSRTDTEIFQKMIEVFFTGRVLAG